MKYLEIERDLFTMPDEYYLAQCISSDFGLGAGIAVLFNEKRNIKHTLLEKYGRDYKKIWSEGDCLLVNKVFNLVTKHLVFEKPTYEDLKAALEAMKVLAEGEKVDKIAMPLIGCGIDGLEWTKVSKIIKTEFDATDIEIVVCRVPKKPLLNFTAGANISSRQITDVTDLSQYRAFSMSVKAETPEEALYKAQRYIDERLDSIARPESWYVKDERGSICITTAP